MKGTYVKSATIIAIGIVFLVFGIIGLATGGVTYMHKKKVVDVGSVEISRETRDTFLFPPVLGTIALGLGLTFVSVGIKKGSFRPNRRG